jgi:DNA-binding XRE family transcriptional regulator
MLLIFSFLSLFLTIFAHISNIFPMDAQLLGLQIKNRRNSLDLTQEDLAEMAGITIKTLHLVESGQGNPSLSTITKILGVLGLEFFVDIKRPR